MARDRVASFVRAWKKRDPLDPQPRVIGMLGVDLMVADLEALSKPRVVVRTLAQLCALPVGTILKLQGDRAGQIEDYETYDDDGELHPATRIVYAGTDLDDRLVELDRETADTLRRMLPAIVIDPID